MVFILLPIEACDVTNRPKSLSESLKENTRNRNAKMIVKTDSQQPNQMNEI